MSIGARLLGIVVLLVALGADARIAVGEPISITGTISLSRAHGFADVRLSGSNGLTVNAGINPFANFGPSDVCWIACPAGTLINLSTRTVSVNDIVGSATVGGETFRLGGISSNFGLLDLNVDDAFVTVPSFGDGTDRLMVPILLTGSLLYPFPGLPSPTRSDTLKSEDSGRSRFGQ